MPGSYISVNGKAKKVKKIYYGVNGVAKAVKSVFCSVDGIAKNAFASQAGGVIAFSVPKWTRSALATDSYCFFDAFEALNKDAELSVINKKYVQVKQVHNIPAGRMPLKFNGYAMLAGGLTDVSTYTPTDNVVVYTNNLTSISGVSLSKGRYDGKAATIKDEYAVFLAGYIADDRDDTTYDVFNKNLVRVVSGSKAKYLYYNFSYKMGVSSFDKYAVFGGGWHGFGDNNEEVLYFDENLLEHNAYFSHEGSYCVAASNSEYVIFAFEEETRDNAFNKNWVRTVTNFKSNVASKYQKTIIPQVGVSTGQAAIFLAAVGTEKSDKSFCIFECDKNLLLSYNGIDYSDDEYLNRDYGDYTYYMTLFGNKLVATNKFSTTGIAFGDNFL